nr:IPT/TIG domain protein [Neobacillus sp. Marseille-Q6967]
MDERVLSRKKTNKKKKTKLHLKRIYLSLLTLVLILSSGIFWVNTGAAEEPPRLSKVGPINNATGYPLWYKDSEGTRLELCLDYNDPLCAFDAAEFGIDTSQPLSVATGNFPDESFYMLAGAEMETGTGGRALGGFQLEAAFAQEVPIEGDQIVFGRVRIRVDGLIAGEKYKVIHPYGTDEFVAEVEDEDDPIVGEINFTEDIGITGGFSAAMDSRIGRFIKWDPEVTPAAPTGYLGDPNVDHKIVGGVNGQNYFRIEGPGIGRNGANGAFSPNACRNTDGTQNPNCIQTDMFSVMGKEATTSGVEKTRATYSRTTAGEGTIDIFAFTEESKSQTVEVTTTDITTPIVMDGANGQYFTRVTFSGTTIPKITIKNTSDNPDTVIENMEAVDKIDNAKATYNIDNNTLTVKGVSSDQFEARILTVKEFNQPIENGTVSIADPAFVPPNITITSSGGGSITILVDIEGGPSPSNPPIADAGADQTVDAGATVTLQGNNTGGTENTTILWEQVSPDNPTVELTGSDTLTPTFTAPATGGTFVFRLTLTSPDGESTSDVTVNISGNVPQPVANAGADQVDIQQMTTNETTTVSTIVTLDGSASQNAATYEWSQLDGTPVSLNLSNPVKPTFMAPKKTGTLTFKLTARGADGKTTHEDEVKVTILPDNLTVAAAEYDRRNRSWRIDGTSTTFGPNVKVTIYVGSVDPLNKLAEVDVDTTGAFRYRGTGKAVGEDRTIIVESSAGGKLTYNQVRQK